VFVCTYFHGHFITFHTPGGLSLRLIAVSPRDMECTHYNVRQVYLIKIIHLWQLHTRSRQLMSVCGAEWMKQSQETPPFWSHLSRDQLLLLYWSRWWEINSSCFKEIVDFRGQLHLWTKKADFKSAPAKPASGDPTNKLTVSLLVLKKCTENVRFLYKMNFAWA